MLFSINVDGIKVMVNSQHKTIYQALNFLYFNIPHFCYNKNLYISGNCRMCLVEVVNVPKPIVSCAVPITPNINIITKSPFVFKARENILEFLLINHPIDCAVCDQAGECDLQEYSLMSGQTKTRYFHGFKKAVAQKNIDFLIRTSMNRCINCRKCTRLSFKIGSENLSLYGRSLASEIYNFLQVYSKKKLKLHELYSTLIDICPVFAFLNKSLFGGFLSYCD
jgi:NADH dehydrogenase/NADH:ubiquinone oxidoreductase subunit G